MPSTLEQWLERIDSIHQQKWDPGLDRISAVAARLELQKPGATVITVAGTNGKGSTVELIDNLCRDCGLRVGKTTSPHFQRFNERIIVAGQPVPDEVIVTAFERIDVARGDITITYFEFAALAALIIFSEASLDVVLLEIGLGGRLDAFNIVDADIAVITRIALDHESWLGSTREQIGREKAGILRREQVCVLNDPEPPESVLEVAQVTGTRMVRNGDQFSLSVDAVVIGDERWPLPERMILPRESAAAALLAVSLAGYRPDPERFTAICERAALPGRWQWLAPNILIDVAHNPDAAAYLVGRLAVECRGRRVHAVVGMYGDKNIDAVFALLNPVVASWHLCAVAEARAASTATLEAAAQRLPGTPFVASYDKVVSAFTAAKKMINNDDLVLVFGSFPVVAAVLAAQNGSDS